MRYCQQPNRAEHCRAEQLLHNRLTRSASGRLLLPSWHFAPHFGSFCSLGSVPRPGEVGMRSTRVRAWTHAAAAAAAAVRASVRACAQVFLLALGVVRALTMKEIHLERFAGRETDVKWSFSSSSSSGGATRLLSPSASVHHAANGDRRVSVSPAGCRYRWTICGGSRAKEAASAAVRRERTVRAGGSARCGRACGRAGRGDASRHRSIEQTED